MSFPLGKPIAAMIVITLVAGAYIALRPRAPRADHTIWLFADDHARMFRDHPPLRPGQPPAPSLVEQYQAATGQSLEVHLTNARALDVRLLSLINNPPKDAALPDLVEVEIGSIGKYFRPPVDEIGFLPLNKYLEAGPNPWIDRIVKSRFAPWSKGGQIFGVPHDLHPVTITYRADLFAAADVDLTAVQTWPQFQQACLRYQDYWHAHGHPDWHAIELPRSSSDDVIVMLLQRGVNLVDDQNHLHFDDPKVVDTLRFYCGCVADMPAGSPDTRIAADATPGTQWVRELAAGRIGAVISPDWKIAYIAEQCPTDDAGHLELQGKLAMIPLPVFDATDAPTSTWGGTMVGIPRTCKNPDAAWKLLEFMYLSPQALAARREFTRILPPVKSAWADPSYHRPPPADGLFIDQKVDGCWLPDELYIHLADCIPRRIVTPYSLWAAVGLSQCVSHGVSYIESHGTAGFDDAAKEWLRDAAADLQQRMQSSNTDE